MEYREIQARADAAAGGFDGYASTWGAVDSYGTAFAKGAFRKSLRERGDRIPVLLQHNPDWQIGVPTALREDGTGLYHEVRLFEDGGTTVGTGQVALAQLRQGARFGMSFGFSTLQDRAAKTSDALDLSQMPDLGPGDVRVITEVKLFEISLVTFPANEQAGVTAVRAEESAETLAGVIEAMRDGRLTDEQARAIEELVRLWSERTAGPAETPPTDEPPKRQRAIGTEWAWLRIAA